jgi:hypothetical protein
MQHILKLVFSAAVRRMKIKSARAVMNEYTSAASKGVFYSYTRRERDWAKIKFGDQGICTTRRPSEKFTLCELKGEREANGESTHSTHSLGGDYMNNFSQTAESRGGKQLAQHTYMFALGQLNQFAKKNCARKQSREKRFAPDLWSRFPAHHQLRFPPQNGAGTFPISEPIYSHIHNQAGRGCERAMQRGLMSTLT